MPAASALLLPFGGHHALLTVQRLQSKSILFGLIVTQRNIVSEQGLIPSGGHRFHKACPCLFMLAFLEQQARLVNDGIGVICHALFQQHTRRSNVVLCE